MIISNQLGDDVVLIEMGQRIARQRIDLQLTQASLAEQAGIAKRTVERIEAGASAQLTSVIRVLRVLKLLTNLDQLIPDTGPRPMDLLKRKGKARQRASTSRQRAPIDEVWTWDEDT